jgi:hypothetical protein
MNSFIPNAVCALSCPKTGDGSPVGYHPLVPGVSLGRRHFDRCASSVGMLLSLYSKQQQRVLLLDPRVLASCHNISGLQIMKSAPAGLIRPVSGLSSASANRLNIVISISPTTASTRVRLKEYGGRLPTLKMNICPLHEFRA